MSTAGKVDLALRDRFVAEAPREWKRLAERFADFEADARERLAWELGSTWKEMNSTSRYCVGKDVRQKLIVIEGGNRIAGSNERYIFLVQRTDEQAPFQLVRAVPSPPGPDPLTAGHIDVGVALESCWRIWGIPLVHILGDQNFVLITLEQGTVSATPGEPTVRIGFRYDGLLTRRPLWLDPGSTYWAELLPERSWAVFESVAVGVRDTAGVLMRMRVSVEYQDWFHHCAFPRRVLFEIEDVEQKKVVETKETVYESPLPCQRTAEEFFLHHYGLSEASVTRCSTSSVPPSVAQSCLWCAQTPPADS